MSFSVGPKLQIPVAMGGAAPVVPANGPVVEAVQPSKVPLLTILGVNDGVGIGTFDVLGNFNCA